MIRTCHAVSALVVGSAALALGGCASPAEPALQATIAARSQGAGIAPELVYVTDVDGFELVTQSVGVMGSDGMSAVYARHDGGYATLMLTTSRDADPSGVPCTELADSATAATRCSVQRGEAHVVLEGGDLESATLRAAGEAVRVPGADELDRLFADVPTSPDAPVERGDLPPHGDGAPLNPVGPGG